LAFTRYSRKRQSQSASSAPGKYWTGCSASDKEKRYLCTVFEFIAVHDFGGGIKGAGFQVKEMGEDGKGSLELGVASGEVFILAYPHPFLEYYWYANRSELDASVRLKLFPTLEHAVVAGDAGAAEQDDGSATAVGAERGARL
jgi:hypothetical protein